jgi:RimJ/RimL family protein N-acetyltransferase
MIEGKLVNLRAREMSDVERMTCWVNDREVARFQNARYPWSSEAEDAFVRRTTSVPITFADLRLAIDTKDGVHIGGCGLHGASPENRTAELGIMVGDKAYWSKGYGTDAVATLVRFGFDEMNLNRIELHVYDFNERAQASYRKCGFVDEGRMRDAHYAEGVYCDVVVMGLLRSAWLSTDFTDSHR